MVVLLRLTVVFRLFLFVGFLSLIACDEEEEFVELKITSIEPASAIIGGTIHIVGDGFNTDALKNEVMFFGDVVAEVVSATSTRLEVIVPAGALTGFITVTANDQTASSATEFVVSPSINDFEPKSASAGSIIVITGSGFSATKENNIVMFNDIEAVVIQSTSTSISVMVPTTGADGKISVKVGAFNTTTIENFIYIPRITNVTPLVSAVNRVITITGSGFSTVASENIVRINDLMVPIITSGVNSISITVPENATTGNISVTKNTNTAIGPVFEVVIEAIHAGSINYENGYAIATDLSGSTYVVGSFTSELNFGNITLMPQSEDIFVVKYNKHLSIEWAKKIGGAGADRGISIVVDNLGNSYIGGYSDNKSFVAKLNTVGELVWSSIIGSSGSLRHVKLHDNYLFVTGNFTGTILTGGTSLVASGNDDILVAKLDKDTGSPIWIKKFGGTDSDFASSLCISSTGSIYIAASKFGSFTIGSTSLPDGGGLDAFLFKLDANGDPLWAKSISGPSWENLLSVTLDEAENPVVTGYFTNSVTVGNTTLNSSGNEDMILAKFAGSNGDLIWSVKAGGTNYDHGNSVIADASGNIYVTGYFEYAATFGSVNIPNVTSSRDVFVAKYNSQGVLVWIKKAGGNESDQGEDIVMDSFGILHVVGNFRTFPITLESTTLNNVGGDDVFVWKIWQ